MARTQTVRIVSTGRSARDTQVFDAETGEPLSGFVSRVDVTLDAEEHGPPRAVVHLLFPALDVIADARIEQRPIDMTDPDAIAEAIAILRAHWRTLTTKELPHAL